MRQVGAADGPGAFFRRHHGLLALSVAGALGTSAYATVSARRVGSEQRARWWALAALTAAQAVGLAIAYARATERER